MTLMHRPFSSFACILGLLLALAVVAMWIDSYPKCHEVFVSPSDYTLWAYSSRGDIVFAYDAAPGETSVWRIPGANLLMQDRVESEHAAAGFRMAWGRHVTVLSAGVIYYGPWGFRIGAPHWFVAMLLAIGPIIWLTCRYLDQRRHSGHCAKCGYDLTGNASGQCSECGHEVRAPITNEYPYDEQPGSC